MSNAAANALPHRLLSPAIGAELNGIQLLSSEAAAIEAVRAALDRDAVVLLRDQKLTPTDLIQLTRRFGEPERFDATRSDPRHPEVCIVTNDPRADQAAYWHSDGYQQPEPPAMSLFYAVKTLTAGGDTLFTDARRALESLPGELREQIAGRRALLPNGHAQPMVRVHPRTGRPALYIDLGVTSGIEGLEREAARDLLKALRDHLSSPERVYAHKWKPGDLVIWDNAAALHSATQPPPSDELRLMWRTTVRGGAVIAG